MAGTSAHSVATGTVIRRFVLESIKAKWGKNIDALRAKKTPRRELYSQVKLARARETEELAQTRQMLSLPPKAKEPTPAPVPAHAPTTDKRRETLLAIAKQEIIKVESPWQLKIKPERYYLEQIKLYTKFIAEAEDKAAAFCQERIQTWQRPANNTPCSSGGFCVLLATIGNTAGAFLCTPNPSSNGQAGSTAYWTRFFKNCRQARVS